MGITATPPLMPALNHMVNPAPRPATNGAPARTTGTPGTIATQAPKTLVAASFQREAQAAQRFAAMFIDEVLQETMPNMFGNTVGAQSYQSMFMQSLSKDMAQSASGMGLMPLLEKSLHIPASAMRALEDHPEVAPYGSTTPEVKGLAGPISADARAFVKKLTPLVDKAAQALGVAPRLIMAQIALETGWGQSVVGNNLFGIKATPGALSVLAATHEAGAGGQLLPTMAAFRAFPDIAACVHHYIDLLKSQYPGAVGAGANAQAFAQGLIQGHYATDPAYAQKLLTLAQSPLLTGMP